jgi:hypothetical protein
VSWYERLVEAAAEREQRPLRVLQEWAESDWTLCMKRKKTRELLPAFQCAKKGKRNAKS